MTNKDQELPEGRLTDADFTDSPVSPDSPDVLAGTAGTAGADGTGSSAAEIPETTDIEDTGDTDNTGDATTVGPGHDVTRTIAGSTWVALIIGAVVLVLLLVFILQNGDSAELNVFFWTWNFPIGVGMLIAAVGGALVAASVGTIRIFQLRRQVRKGN